MRHTSTLHPGIRSSALRSSALRSSALRLVGGFAIAGTAAFGLAACSGSNADAGTGGASASTSTSAAVLPPVIEMISELDGETVSVPLSNTVDLVTEKDSDVTAWSATIADDTVAEFIPGRVDGGATFNPGLKPLAEGSTDVVLTDSATGEKVSFTLEVTAG